MKFAEDLDMARARSRVPLEIRHSPFMVLADSMLSLHDDFAEWQRKEPGSKYFGAVLLFFYFVISLEALSELPHGKLLAYCELALYAGTFVLISVFVLVTSRWSPPNVFISYHIEDFSVADAIKQALGSSGIAAYVDEPGSTDRADANYHNDVNRRIRIQLNAADAIVAIPGSRLSYLDAEVAMAFSQGKPVIFLSRGADDKLPDTAVSGYAVFAFDMLAKDGFRPLSEFLYFLDDHISQVMPLLVQACITAIAASGLSSLVFRFFGGIASFMIPASWGDKIETFILVGIAIVAPLTCAGVAISVVYSRRFLNRVARQLLETRTPTPELLRTYLPKSLRHISNYLSPTPLPLR